MVIFVDIREWGEISCDGVISAADNFFDQWDPITATKVKIVDHKKDSVVK